MRVHVALADTFILDLTLREPYFTADQPALIACDILRLGNALTDAVQIALDEETISQPHCELLVRAGRLLLRDLNSHYGTIVLDGFVQKFESRLVGGYRQLAALAEQSREIEYVFDDNDRNKDLTLQLGQVGVILRISRR